ncbi:uncharacterized protein LOC115996997 [Ipomoea triloba]|uniref:uncharacterized protein LOC115996997 n=1 Tax=Ipomoea triloba TaxID=35885 RepID=UPI00125D567B|nr:uncharacterized protein LOC115996997 [Ipomoea triloba]
MEFCNKTDALRAKDMAEKKLAEKDYVGAQELALRAQTLFAGLDGLSKLLEVINIHVRSQRKINGEVDWYAVLGADSSVSDETLRRRYRRLVLALHPDKNKSTGADGAFAIVAEAWGMLSDKAKRASYDQRRAARNVSHGNPAMEAGQNAFHAPMSTPSARPWNPSMAHGQSVFHTRMSIPSAMSVNPSMASGQNIFHGHMNTPIARPPASIPSIQPTSMPPHQPGNINLCTKCTWCGTGYEYPRLYLNRILVCGKCQKSYWAAPVARAPEQASFVPFGQQQPYFSPASSQSSASGTRYFTVNVQATADIHRTGERLRTGGAGADANTSSTDSFTSEIQGGPMKKRRMDGQASNSERKGRVGQMAAKSGSQANVSGNQKAFIGAQRVAPNRSRDFTQPQIRSMLMEKAVLEIRKKVNEWNLNDAVNASLKEDKNLKKPTATASVPQDSVKDGMKGNNVDGASMHSGSATQNKKSSVSAEPTDEDSKAIVVQSMSVPDSDFHDFDKDRIESSFAENEVWAAYDNDDGMPRYYAMIKKVMSKSPFKTTISWLNSKSNNELGPMKWILSGFPKTSGDFWIGKSAVCSSLNTFSHKVKWTKGLRGVIQIFPSKGDVWALYRNWSPEWNTFTPDDEIHSYEMVLVLEDFSENEVARVVPLTKVPGYRSVFKQQSDPNATRAIPKVEIFRFSHQVLSYVLTGEEAPNVLEGFLELDPAALPPDLLQVITEPKEVEEDGSTCKKLPAEDMSGGEVKPQEADTRNDSKEKAPESVASKPLLTYSKRPKGYKATAKPSA